MQNLEIAKAILIKSRRAKRLMLLAALLSSSSCTGIGARAEIYRIDEREESTTSRQVPLKCLFVNCNGGEK